MEFHLIQAGAVGRRKELEQGMAGQRDDLYQRYLEEVRAYVQAADELGYAGYGHNEHHLQIEGFEVTNHPGMSSMFIGLNSKRLRRTPWDMCYRRTIRCGWRRRSQRSTTLLRDG